mmetsp:Transcript_17042/g.55914  ORF Transcript_17042/g.55914 Transcript_17042/m.55914 type:complete len:104 (+) Transcript_17042:893-1204(+)
MTTASVCSRAAEEEDGPAEEEDGPAEDDGPAEVDDGPADDDDGPAEEAAAEEDEAQHSTFVIVSSLRNGPATSRASALRVRITSLASSASSAKRPVSSALSLQ